MTRAAWTGLVAFLVVLGLAALALVLRDGDGRTGSEGKERTEEARPPATSDTAEPVTLVADGDTGRERAPTEVSGAPDDEAPTPSSEDAPVEAGPLREVELIEAASGRRLPGAEAWIVAGSLDWSPRSFDGQVARAEARRADDEGVLRLPRSAGAEVLVLARAGDLCGGGVVGEPDALAPRPRLALHRDWDVTVEVSGADGSAAPDVPVRCGVSEGGPLDYGFRSTDGDGRIVLPHVGLAFALARAEALDLRVDLPLAEPLARRVLPGVPPADPVRFRLPSGGALEVEVEELDGEPATDSFTVRYGVVRPGEPRELSPFQNQERLRVSRVTENGRALFPFVPLGAEIELLVSRQGNSAETREYFPGPRVAGERLLHTVVVGLALPLLEFRAVDEGGAPLAGTTVDLELLVSSSLLSNRNEMEVETDAEGRFHLELGHVYREGDRVLLLAKARDGALAGQCDLSRPFERGRVPMGDLVLGRAPLLVAGRVLSDSGAPVEGARVTFETPVSQDPDDPDGLVWYWSDLEPALVTDATGAFELHALALARRVRARAANGSERSAPLVVDAGARGVELVLRGTGGLAGRLLLDSGVPRERLELRAAALDPDAPEEEPSEWTAQASPRADGEFTLPGLLSGPHWVQLSVHGQGALVTLSDVRVEAGTLRRDPRLDPLDLRGQLRCFRLTLVPPEPVESLTGSLEYGGEGSHEREWMWFDHSPIDVVTNLSSFDGTLSLPGFRAVELRDVDGDRELHLERALEVRLVLPPEIPLPDPPRFLKATLVGTGEGGQSMDWGGEPFDERREIVCRPSAVGTLQVRWITEWHGNGGASATSLDLEPAQTFEVEDRPGQRFELRVDPEALRKAIEAAER